MLRTVSASKVALYCLAVAGGFASAAPEPVTAISAHYESTFDRSGDYTDVMGNRITFNRGDDNLLFVDSITVNGNRLDSDKRADRVLIQRVTSNSCSELPGCNRNIGGITGEKLFFQYPYLGSPFNHDLAPPRAYSFEKLYLDNAINISADNPLGNLDNNIERIDIIFNGGVVSPETVGEREHTGFMIPERWGNNPHLIAAISSLDASGKPAGFYPLSKGNISHYGNTQFTIRHSDGSVSGPAPYTPASHRYKNQDQPVIGGVAGSKSQPLNGLPDYFLSTMQPVRAAFHSFDQLGIPSGATIYGFSAFGIDVTQDMDLVGLTDVPLNTDRIIADSADIFGSIGTLFIPGEQATIGIAKEVTGQREIETGVYEVDLAFVVENLSKDTVARNVQVSDNLALTFTGVTSFEVIGEPDIGRFSEPEFPYDGRDQIDMLSGSDSLAAGAHEIIRLTVRVQTGLSSGIYLNSALVTTAYEPGGEPNGSDLSDEGSEPDSDGDGFANGPGEDDPTAILLGPDAGLITVDKTVGKTQVSVGDVVSYSLTIRNNAGRVLEDVEIQDTPPGGFNYLENSGILVRRGGDGQFGTADDISVPLEPRGENTLIFGPIELASQEIVKINYLLRVGAGVTPGEHRNVAIPYLSDDPAGTTDVVAVEVIRDSAFQEGTIIGVVFHDRDRDGYQDAAHATNVDLRIHGVEQFLDTSNVRFLAHEDQRISGNYSRGFRIDEIESREFETRSEKLRQVQLIVPILPGTTKANLQAGRVTLESAEGTWLEGSLLGSDRVIDKRGDVSKGVNSQRLAFFAKMETGERGQVLVITVSNDAIDEAGVPGVRLATTQGLLIETDSYGRYHLAETDLTDYGRGGNYIIKVDPHTLPNNAQFTTENPRVLRITNNVLNRINFGVTLPEQSIPVSDVERIVPTHTEMQEQLNIDFSTHFIDDEIGPIRFDSGKSELDKTSIDQLAPVVEELKGKENIELRATGHTDPVPLNSRLTEIYGDNQGLSEARARAVAGYINQDDRFDGIQVSTDGRAYHDPVASNNTREGRARNRRVEVQIVYDESVKKWVTVPVQVPEKIVVEKRPLLEGGTLWVTEDPSINDPRLSIVANQQALINNQGQLNDLLTFTVYTNYDHFIKHWELQLFSPTDRSLTRPAMVLQGDKLRSGMRIDVASLKKFGVLKPGQKIPYKLKVHDDDGHWDETRIRQVRLTDNEESISDSRKRVLDEVGNNSLNVQSIPIRGSRVRVYGAAVSDEYVLTLDGQTLEADGNGAFVSEQHLPIGEHVLELAYRDSEGVTWQREIDVDVRGDYLFMVGLANLTVGGNHASGMLEDIEEDDQFDDKSFVNARGAFYLKGKIKGKYLVTAQLDTREDEFRNLDDQLKRKDRTTLFRELDPERYYPVYGDDSTIYSDVDTQGAYYVRVDWDKSRALWGNFNTDLTSNEFAQYNRTLYGAQLVYRMPELTKHGEYRNLLAAFVSEAQSASAHNEFQATGGSLYYLQQTDIVVGSEKLWIEIREKNTTRVVERYSLRSGIDYEIDYFQGRIILSRPLSQIARTVAPSIIQDEPLQGNTVHMLADYEYVPDNFSFDNVVGGVRGKTWIGDSIGIGATAVDEERDAEDYNLQGLDLTYQLAKGTYVKGEFARSEASQASSGFISDDGGLTFETSPLQNSIAREGEAVGAEIRVDLSEVTSGDEDGEITAWYKDRDAGFSSSRDDTGIQTRDKGIYSRWAATDDLQFSVRSKQLETGENDSRISHSAQVDGELSDRFSAGLEIQRTENTLEGIEEKATLAGGKLSYRLRQETSIYGKVQSEISSNDAYEDNDQYAIGVNSRRSDKLTLGGEVVTGDRGDGLILGVDYRLTDKAGVSVSAGFGDNADSLISTDYTLDNGLNLYGNFAQTTADNNEEKTTYTLGQRKAFGNNLAVYAENQLSDTDSQSGLTHVFGVDYDYGQFVGLSFSVQNSSLSQNDGSDISRNAATAGIQYRKDNTRLSTRLEYRRDRSDIDTTQWLSSSAIEWKQTRDYRWLGRLNHSITRNDDTNSDEARFTEASVGFAYRPALNDRFNMLTRLTYIDDLPSPGQDSTAVDERAWVLATEGAYALTSRWELGGKIAGKRGQVRQQRASGRWFDSNTRFYATRIRYHMIKNWDGLAEYRWLETVEDEAIKSGALLALYRHVGEHVKVGLGFNFTDFNDDLTNLDYDNRGWFLDITAKY